ncbi:MAG: iron-containing alcohol dehydrogenase, partial [Chitinophagaceae bacterium]
MTQISIAPSPQTYIGWGALDKLPECIKKFGDRVLLVADPFLLKIGVVDRVVAAIKTNEYHYDL